MTPFVGLKKLLLDELDTPSLGPRIVQRVMIDLALTENVPLRSGDIGNLIEECPGVSNRPEVLERARLTQSLIVLMQDDGVKGCPMTPLVDRLVRLDPLAKVHQDVRDMCTGTCHQPSMLQIPLGEPKLEGTPVDFHAKVQAALRVYQSMEGLCRIDCVSKGFSVWIKDDGTDFMDDRLAAYAKSLDVYHQVHTFSFML